MRAPALTRLPPSFPLSPSPDDDADRQTRIQVLTEQIDKLRDRYSTVKAELGRVHRRIKKLKKKQREGEWGRPILVCGMPGRYLGFVGSTNQGSLPRPIRIMFVG